MRCYREVLRYVPNHLEALNNFGDVLCRMGRYEDAICCLQEALRHRPDFADTHYNLGTTYCLLDRIEEAVTCFQEALRLKPENPDAFAALGVMLEGQGKPDEALACFGRAMKLRPHDHLRVLMAVCLPVIHQSVAELEFWRERVWREIRSLRESEFICDLTDVPRRPLFNLAYQGRNDRDIQREFAFLHRAPPAPSPPPPRPTSPSPLTESFARIASGGKARIHVGFLSANFFTHTIGHWMRGLIALLSRDDFEVTVFSVGNHKDPVADFIKKHAERVLVVPGDLPSARHFISQQRLDILFYPDIGIDAFVSTLAFSRLAPVQCVTMGHPVTTGINTIDYFISAEDLEVQEADEHYTETLVRLKKLPFYFYRPPLPRARLDREHFGLAREHHVYACTQSMFKLHPEFDETLAAILRADPNGILVLFQGRRPHWDELLKRRFALTLPDVLSRIRFLPVLRFAEYLSLLMCSDALLDTRPFGGGTTSLEGLAVGTPIVTLPSRLLRGRITYALYKQMNVLDCVASSPQEYVDIATRLGKDIEYRQAIRQKILASNSALFENSQGIRELEQFFRDVVKH